MWRKYFRVKSDLPLNKPSCTGKEEAQRGGRVTEKLCSRMLFLAYWFQNEPVYTYAYYCLRSVWLSCICAAAAPAKSLQSCPTLCDPMDRSLPGFSVHGILQARTLEWVVISFSNAWKWKVKVKSLSHVQLLATPWTAAYQAPPSMEFSRQQYWSGLLLPSPMYLCRRLQQTNAWVMLSC